jgi:ABC-2 type transport system permease protein
MSTATLDRPHRPAYPAPQAGSNFSGTLRMLRLYLRRDRISLPLWVLLLSVPLASVYVGSILKVYPTEAARAGFAASIMASPAQRALYGQIYNTSLGAVGIWKAGMFHLLIAIAVILTVIRHTRADEETGRTELIDSTAVGRYASLTAALMLSFGASIATGAIGAAGLLTTDIPAAGSLAFGAALAGSGLVFTAVAAVAAQLSPSARFARGLAFAVLGAAFTLRAIGDAGSGTLSWLSPLGWSLQVRPYAGDRWWVLLLHLATTAVLTVVAYRLLAGRDVGAGLIAERAGPGTAGTGLRSVFGLTWRLDRGALLLWTVGLGLYGLLMGSVTYGIGDELGDSTIARDIVARMGGTSALEQAFIAVAFTMLGMVAAAFAVSLTLRLHQEEAAQRAETTLAGAVSRTRWLASHLVAALGGSAAAMLVAGLAAGLVYGTAAGDIAGKLAIVVGTAAVQLPAVWLLSAVTLALFGLAPRFTPVAWGVLVGFVALYLIGSLAGFPQWLLDLEPFAHTPRVGGGDFTAVPLLWLLAIDATMIAVGAVAFRRRDVRC